MTTRVVAVVLSRAGSALPSALSAAMAEDVVDLIAAMPHVDPALLATAATGELAEAVRWPGTPVLPIEPGADVAQLLAALVGAGADEAAIVTPDAPDLPPLLLGKLFSALTSVDAAACPADDGGLVALASKVPVPGWLGAAGVSLDDPAALERLRRAAPRRALQVGPGWHRVRATADLDRLDQGLEGWDATRAYLASLQ